MTGNNFPKIEVSKAGSLPLRSLALLCVCQQPLFKHLRYSLPRAAVKVTTMMFPSAEMALRTETKVARCLGLVHTWPKVRVIKRPITSAPPAAKRSSLGIMAA